MILEQHPEIQHLSSEEKLILVAELWDDLAAHPSEIPVQNQVIEELERRAEEYRKNPDAVVAWSDVKARILSSKSR